ncbi:MAG: chorismate-binding protein, partial [Candidatus Heimdallarchaeota archaeon]|nr:chorismate-binding protein [Candidatus Heimdallarchaeota archaeon]
MPRSIIGLNGKKRNQKSGVRNQKYLIGYYAYPNVGLKNIIPSSRFYEYEELIHLKTPPIVDANFKTTGRLEQSVTKPQYIQKIKQIKELLAAGEVYQINFAIRFRKKFEGNPYALFLKLTEVNPVDFSV